MTSPPLVQADKVETRYFMLPESYLKKLRCPDCLEEDLSPDGGVRSSQGREGRLICRRCGRTLELRRGILHALPRDVAEAVESNRQYYNTLSARERNLLERRAATRNHRNKMAVVLEALGLSESGTPRSVLELGTGFGAHGAALQRKGHDYAGLDISPGLLEQAAERFPALGSALLVAGDATRTPFRDGRFEGVFCVATLHHLPHPQAGIREAVRVLAPGGRFCFLEPKRFYPTQLAQYLRHRSTEVSAMKVSPASVARWLGEAGMADSRVTYAIFTPNGPARLTPLWDGLDRLCRRARWLHPLSVMFCVYGCKP